MYKVLIIDDEEPLREAIHILGDWENLGVDQILEATNGKVGLDMLRHHKIDLVLMDMKMPEMDGNQLLQFVNQEFPDLLLIVISGYDDFEYARQAMRSKAVDYLLKPVNRKDLNKALRKAVDLLEVKHKEEFEFINRNITLNMSLPKLKEKIYQSIINRSFKPQFNADHLPLIGADKADHLFSVGILRILNLNQVQHERFNEDPDLFHFSITNVMNECSSGQLEPFSFVSPKGEREFIVVSTMERVDVKEAAYLTMQHMKKSISTLKGLFGFVCVGGIGESCSDFLDIAASYEQAKISLDGIDLLSIKEGMLSSVVHTKQLSQNNSSLTGRMPLIRNALESGNINHAKSILGELTKVWSLSEYFSLSDADRAIQEFIILLNVISIDMNVVSEQLRSGIDKGPIGLDLIDDFVSFAQFERVLSDILDIYTKEICKIPASSQSLFIEDIKGYIESHYFEDIKISMFTEKYFLSREYLMKLFKAQFGYGIHKYVQKVRMDKAKVLLGDPTCKIQDISDMLGYKDKNYFSKAFRNYYQCSPSEYRLSLLTKGKTFK